VHWPGRLREKQCERHRADAWCARSNHKGSDHDSEHVGLTWCFPTTTSPTSAEQKEVNPHTCQHMHRPSATSPGLSADSLAQHKKLDYTPISADRNSKGSSMRRGCCKSSPRQVKRKASYEAGRSGCCGSCTWILLPRWPVEGVHPSDHLFQPDRDIWQ